MDNNNQHITEILADCLDAMQSGSTTIEECTALYPEYAAELADLLQTVSTIKRQAVARPSAAFQKTARARLLEKLPDQAAAAKVGFFPSIGQIFTTRQTSFVLNRIAILVVLAAILLGSGGVAYAASGDALPGDALYGFKIGAEDIRLAFASDTQDIELYNRFLAERTFEIGALVGMGRFDDLNPAVERYEQHVAVLVQSMLNNPALGETVMEQARQAQQERQQAMIRIMENAPEAIRDRLRQMLSAEEEQLSPGPGIPGIDSGESGQGDNKPDQGESDHSESQGDDGPGIGNTKITGTAIPDQGQQFSTPDSGPDTGNETGKPTKTTVPGQGQQSPTPDSGTGAGSGTSKPTIIPTPGQGQQSPPSGSVPGETGQDTGPAGGSEPEGSGGNGGEPGGGGSSGGGSSGGGNGK